MTKFRMLESKYFQHKIPLAALDYYDQNSHGEDDFSRKQVWFYSYGDDEIEAEFREGLNNMFETLFSDDDTKWDLITLYPTHAKGVVNPNLRDLMMDVSADNNIPMDQVLERTETIHENHVMKKEKTKAVNLEGSIKVTRDVKDKNIIIVDNIALSGLSMLHGAELLKKHGANKVFAVSLGTALEKKDETTKITDENATQLLRRAD